MADPARAVVDCNAVGKNIVMSTPLKVGDTAQLDTTEDTDATMITNNGNV
jgi:hypothetical protein